MTEIRTNTTYFPFNNHDQSGFEGSILHKILDVKEPHGQFKGLFPLSSKYFEGIFGYPFNEAEADQLDKLCFNIFTCLEKNTGNSNLLFEQYLIELDHYSENNKRVILKMLSFFTEEIKDANSHKIIQKN